MGSRSSGPSPLVLTKCASLGAAGLSFSWAQVLCSLASFLFWSFSFSCFRKLPRLSECLMCSTCTLILLATILPLTCLLTTTPSACWVTSSGFATRTWVGRAFFNSAQSLEVCNITFLADSYVRGQMNNCMFSKRPREHEEGDFPFSLCVNHFWELLEDGSSGQKVIFKFYWGFVFIFIFNSSIECGKVNKNREKRSNGPSSTPWDL